MIDRIKMRVEGGRAFLEVDIFDALDLLNLAVERGLIDGGRTAKVKEGKKGGIDSDKIAGEGITNLLALKAEQHQLNFENPDSLELEKRASEPSLSQVRDYILSKPPYYDHSMPDLSKHFFGRRLYAQGEDHKAFYRLYRKAKEVRDEIKRRYIGHWVKFGVNSKDEKQFIQFKFNQNGLSTKPMGIIASTEVKEED